MEEGKIRLKKLGNTRDLGGLPAADGKTVKKRCLIRSGALFDASPEDLDLLVSDYGVRHIVDFRMPVETDDAPDPVLPGVSYCNLPLLDDSFFGIARDAYSLTAWLNLFSDRSRDPDAVFCEMYRKLLFDDRVKPLYAQFFEILKNAEGAVLWHCSAGKDRAGIAAILVLAALGVPEELILRDYRMTETYTASDVLSAKKTATVLSKDPHIHKAVDTLMSAKELYVTQLFEESKKKWGGLRQYMYAAGILTPEDERILRDRFLD